MSEIDRSVLDEVTAAIEPPDAAMAAEARRRLFERAPGGALGALGPLAERLAAARRRVVPPVERKVLVACAADHGATPGDDAARALRAAAAGGEPLSVLTRAAGATVVLVDFGVRGGADADLGAGVLKQRVGDGTADAGAGPAMAADKALVAVQTGIALVLSLASDGVDVIAVADLAPGGAPAGAALIGELGGGADPLGALARHGGFETGAMAGICLAGAAIRVPVVLDGVAAAAAALAAARLAPAAAGYLLCAQAPAPRDAAHRAALAELALEPLLDLSVAAPGAAAALAFPLLDAAGRLQRELL